VVMNEGRTLQIDAPEELYSRPANLKVARFMGYRNILYLEIERVEQKRISLTGANIRLAGIPLEPLTKGHAVAAIRPEDIQVEIPETGQEPVGAINGLLGQAEIVEYCGREYLVDVLTASGLLLHVRTQRRVLAGDKLRLTIPAERVLVFSPE
jgi:putative spermidine/putrescine transport system ATP-binding protein